MILLRHWKMIVGLMAIFGTGVGTGGVGMIVLLHKVFTSPVSTQRWVDDKMADLDRKLKLTPEQKAKIRPIVTAAAERFRAIGGETFEKLVVTAEQAHADVAKELNPQQQAEFNKMRAQVINSLRDLFQREISVRGAGKRGAAPARPVMETAPDAPRS
jgi:hypothetical protein